MRPEPQIDSGFADQVLERLAIAEGTRARRQRVGYVLPLLAIALVSFSWIASLAVGVTVVHLTIGALAWLGAVGQLELRLSTALLGPFAPLPLLVSMLLFAAALGWVRSHQPDSEGRR